MEKIELRVEQHAGKPLNDPWSAVFGLAGGTVGRGGQNKLILPDTEGDIARVHAMVRLGTSDAYIANLCERRLLTVDNQEVRPGQEVQLPLNACVGIGGYQIKVYTLNQVGERIPPTAEPVSTVPQTERATEPAPEISMGEQPLGAPSTADAGRSPVSTQPAVAVEDTVLPPTDTSTDPQALPNAFDLPPQSSRTNTETRPSRPLVIPADFNPFEVVNRAPPKDEWGGLQAQSLTELAQQSHDGLIKTLPLSGRIQDALDNPAHSGLPKQLDPGQELDPLALFSQKTMVAAAGPDTAEVLEARTSELSHIFQLPRAQGTTSDLGSQPEPQAPSVPESKANAETIQAMQDVGLQTIQGLDLSLFDEGRSPLASVPFTDLPASLPPQHAPGSVLMQQADAPSLEPAQSIPQTERPEVPLQAFGVTLSGDARAFTPIPPTPSLQTTTPLVEQRPEVAATLSSDSAPSTGLEVLANAFLEGAGLTPDRARLELTPEFMRAFGEAFRVAIEGSIDLLSARSEIKQEFRAGVTIIGSSANNPLKFLPNADGVIMQMVGQQFPGFMKPVPAIKEAFADLRVHQFALMAGIRAAYSEALTRFDPLKMEELTPRTGLLGKLSNSAHKAALWDEYKKNFTQIKNAAEDDMTAFSGQTFVNAYEQAASAAKGEA